MRSQRLAIALLMAMLATACNDLPVDPMTPAGSQHQATAVAFPKLHSNREKYRPQTAPHFTGRSGSAALTARALLSKSGETTVEITTGDFDGMPPSGMISKLQLQLLDGKTPATTLNYPGLAQPVWSTSLQDFGRHQELRVQANIRGVDGNRTNVVDVAERVHLRPDLAVTSVSFVGPHAPGVPLSIVAEISELNGDEGARANCVLYINDSEVDRANLIWVADGDDVSCAFMQSLPTGEYGITVAVEAVEPGDWDTANNSRSEELTIASEVLTGSAWAQAVSQRTKGFTFDGQYCYTNPCRFGGSFRSNEYVDSSVIQQTAFSTASAEWTEPLRVIAKLASGGAEFQQADVGGLTTGIACRPLMYAGLEITLCAGTALTYLTVHSTTGQRRYLSTRYRQWTVSCDQWPSCLMAEEYVWVDLTEQTPGYAEYANDVAWDVTVIDGNDRVFARHFTLPLPAYQLSAQYFESDIRYLYGYFFTTFIWERYATVMLD